MLMHFNLLFCNVAGKLTNQIKLTDASLIYICHMTNLHFDRDYLTDSIRFPDIT